MRAARTWMEAHHLLLEIESVSAGTKALINAVYPTSPLERTDGKKKLTTAEKKAQKRANAALKAGAPFVNALIDPACFIARDQGTCTREDCKYNHDPNALAEARKDKAATEAGGQRKPKAKAKPKGKAKKAQR